ncbi:MAG: tungsten ABC transporter substrate-binding protein, partial [Polynucleobacter victoriensis]
MKRRSVLRLSVLAIFAFSGISLANAQKSIVVSSTTSTEQSGLFKHLLPVFEKKTGIQVKVVAVG